MHAAVCGSNRNKLPIYMLHLYRVVSRAEAVTRTVWSRRRGVFAQISGWLPAERWRSPDILSQRCRTDGQAALPRPDSAASSRAPCIWSHRVCRSASRRTSLAPPATPPSDRPPNCPGRMLMNQTIRSLLQDLPSRWAQYPPESSPRWHFACGDGGLNMEEAVRSRMRRARTLSI